MTLRLQRVVLVVVALAGCRNPARPTAAGTDANLPDAMTPPPSSSSPPSPSGDPSATASANAGLPPDWAALPTQSKTGVVSGPAFEKAQNGSVYEVARVPLADVVAEIKVPAGAHILRDGPPHTLFVATAKTLAFRGHPPEPMPIEGLRANMGCASKLEGDTLSIGTFGEWSSKEGGVELTIVVRVPKGVRVGVMSELAGPKSISGQGEGKRLGYWYGRTAPTPGWDRLTLELDPRHIGALGAAPKKAR